MMLPPRTQGTVTVRRSTAKFLHSAVAIYVFLWIFEGAFRKWVPETASALYVLRDMLFLAASIGLLLRKTPAPRKVPWFWLGSTLLLVATAAGILWGTVSPEVAALGLRSYLAPAIFVATVLAWGTAGTVAVIRKVVLCAVPIQVVICVLQASSPARSWINAQVGSDEASFINFGVVRPSGTFSAPAGLLTFVPLALAFSLLAFASRRPRARAVATFLTAACLIIVAVSGARGIVLAVAVIFIAYALSSLLSWKGTDRLPLLPLLVMVAITSVAAIFYFSSILNSFGQRFEDASRSENPGMRLLDQAFGFLHYPVTFLGSGAGSRSQVGIAAGSNLGWLEVDNDRWVAELGLLGLALALLRIGAVALLALEIAKRLQQRDWMFVLVGASFLPTLFSGALTQTPSAQAGAAITIVIIGLSNRRGAGTSFPTQEHGRMEVAAYR